MYFNDFLIELTHSLAHFPIKNVALTPWGFFGFVVVFLKCQHQYTKATWAYHHKNPFKVFAFHQLSSYATIFKGANKIFTNKSQSLKKWSILNYIYLQKYKNPNDDFQAFLKKTKPFNFIIIGAFLFLILIDDEFLLFSPNLILQNLLSQSMVLSTLCSNVLWLTHRKAQQNYETTPMPFLCFYLLMVPFSRVLLDKQ